MNTSFFPASSLSLDMKYFLLSFFIFNFPTVQAQKNRTRVIVIGIDGLSKNGIDSAHTPAFDRMMKEGSWTLNAQAVSPTSSSPNWASMIMGAPPEYHGIWKNGWEKDSLKMAPENSSERGEKWPTVFRIIRKSDPKKNMVVYHQWKDFGRLPGKKTTWRNWFSFTHPLTKHWARNRIRFGTPDLLFLHFDLVDHAGHKYGHGSAEYIHAVEKADKITGKIVKTVEHSFRKKNTVILLTSDHGGIAKGHGGDTPEEKNVPWILWGANVKENFQIQKTVNTFDTAPTICILLGITPPPYWTGIALRECLH